MKKIFFVGAGNMGSAILNTLTGSESVFFYEPNDEQASKINAKRTLSLEEGFSEADVVFLCVKPQVFKTLRFPETQKNNTIVSIMAGVQIAALQKVFPNSQVVRTMPNIAVASKKGTVAIAIDGVPENILQAIESIFSKCASTFRVLENQMDAVTGLSGSGPAFVFQFIEALAMGGVKMGLSREQAMKIALSTAGGSIEMLQKSNLSPSELTASVCSPAGTTISGLQELEDGAFRGTVMAAVEAAAKRSKELRVES